MIWLGFGQKAMMHVIFFFEEDVIFFWLSLSEIANSH